MELRTQVLKSHVKRTLLSGLDVHMGLHRHTLGQSRFQEPLSLPYIPT